MRWLHLVGGRALPGDAAGGARSCSPGRRRSGSPASACCTPLAARPRAACSGSAARAGAPAGAPQLRCPARVRAELPPAALPDGVGDPGRRARGQRRADRRVHRALGAAVGHAAGAHGAGAAGADVALVLCRCGGGRLRSSATSTWRSGAPRRAGRRARIRRRRGVSRGAGAARTGSPAIRRWPARSRWSRSWWWGDGSPASTPPPPARLLGASALMLLAMALYLTLLLRDVLRPVARPAGGAAPPARRRDPRAADAADQAGLLLRQRDRARVRAGAAVRALPGSRDVGAAGLDRAGAGAGAGPRAAHRARHGGPDSRARGALATRWRAASSPARCRRRARPTRSAGSSFAFEEMRRALRDKLRSTESLEHRPRARGPPPHRGARAAQRRAARRAREAAPGPGRSRALGEAGVDGPPGGGHRPRDQQPGERGHQHPGAARGGDARPGATPSSDGASPPPPTRRRCWRSSSGAPPAARRSSRRCTTTRAATSERRTRWRWRAASTTRLDLLRHRLRNVRVEKHIEPGLRLIGYPGRSIRCS